MLAFLYGFEKPPFYKGRFRGVLEYLPKPPQPLLAKEGTQLVTEGIRCNMAAGPEQKEDSKQ